MGEYCESPEIALLRVNWATVERAGLADEAHYTHAQVGVLLDAIPRTNEVYVLRGENSDLRAVAAFNVRRARELAAAVAAARCYLGVLTTRETIGAGSHAERIMVTLRALRDMRAALAALEGG